MATIDTVEGLAAFERRGAGTDAERRAARWLAGELTRPGRQIQVETFWCRPNWALAHAWHVALALAGSLIATSSPRVGIGMLTVALLSVVADDLTGRSLGRRLTPERASQNVIATTKRPAPTRLIITANYDAGRTGFVYRFRPVNLGLGWLGWLCLAVVWLLAVAALRAAGHTGAALDVLQVIPSVGLVIALAALLEAAGAPAGPAAADNASGTAVAIALTNALETAPPRHLAVEVVLQGAGDQDQIGLRRYLRARRRVLRPENAVVLGVAASGSGAPRWWRVDGRLIPLRYSTKMRELSVQVAAGQPQLHAEARQARGAGPAFAARRRRLPALTIGAERPTHSHQTTDTPESLDRAAMDQTTQFGLILIDAIDAFLSTQERAPETVATPA